MDRQRMTLPCEADPEWFTQWSEVNGLYYSFHSFETNLGYNNLMCTIDVRPDSRPDARLSDSNLPKCPNARAVVDVLVCWSSPPTCWKASPNGSGAHVHAHSMIKMLGCAGVRALK